MVAISLGTASAIEVEAYDEPDDGTLVEALVDHAAGVGLPLDEHCIEGIVGAAGIAYLDDELVRRNLLAALEAWAEAPPSTELTVGTTVMVLHRDFLVFDAPVIVDIEELRRQLLTCVAGSADRELVDDVAAVLLATPGFGPFVDERCVTRMLTTFSDDTLRLWLDNPPSTSLAVDIEVTEDTLRGLHWLLQCQDQTAMSATEHPTSAG